MLRHALKLIPLLAGVACAASPPADFRVIVKAADGALLRDPARLVQQVNARTGLVVSLGAAIADDTISLSIRCTEADGGCERAIAALRSSGLFESVEPDRKVKRH